MKRLPEAESTKPRVLVVAGSDSGGGAGIQADIKTITMLGGFAMTAVTALTAQNTLGVDDVLAVEPRFVAQQMKSVLTDIGADAIKTGMLGSARVVEVVADVCESLGVRHTADRRPGDGGQGWRALARQGRARRAGAPAVAARVAGDAERAGGGDPDRHDASTRRAIWSARPTRCSGSGRARC